jgi:HK97 family phage major capsid protein
MPNELDAVKGEIAKLTAAIQEKTAAGLDAKTELQWDDIVKVGGDKIKEMVDLQVAEKLASQPVRPGVAGAPILSGESKALLKNNRYAKHVQDFANHGVYRSGAEDLRPVDLMIAALIMDGQVKNYHPQIGGARPNTMSGDLKNALKAMDSTTATAGDEYVPTNLAPQLWEDMFLASKVVGLFQRVMPSSNPFDIPLGLGSVTWRKTGENIGTTQSNPTTGKVTLAATQLATQQAWSYTLDEDSAIALAPAIRARLAQSGAEQMDSFMLNADDTAAATGNINLDDATPPADSYYLQTGGQDGIRHQWIVDNTTMKTDCSGTLTDAKILTAMALMGKYAVDPTQVVFITDIQTYLAGFLSAATGAPGANTITMEKFGAGATVMTGQLAAYRGIPIVVSASQSLTDVDGKSNVAATTKGTINIVNRNNWYSGFWRNLLIEADRDIQKLQYILVSSFRQGVVAWGTRSSNTHTSGLYNIG